MKTALGTICIALFLWETTTRNAFSQDFDQDGVPDAVENQLLSTLAPVVYADQSNDKPPLTLDYYVRHCRLYWYTAPFGMEVGNTGDTPETVDLMLGQIALHKSQSLNYHYALHFRVGNWNIGQDPNEPITWASLQAAQRGVYGRVDPIAPGRYRVQYFLVFGFNNTSAPDFCGDVEPGSHEGDWISVDFLVEATDLNHPRIYDAVYHNHGRQIFVESPSALTFEGSHPVVYLERGDQETWPRVLTAGFVNWDIQPCVSANKIFHAEVVLGFSFGGEEGTYPVVRPHLGQGPRFLVTTVKNVGNKAHYGSDVEARFFHEFAGWYGTEYERDCSSVPILETEPPSGPVFQDKIWDRAFDTTRAWQTWKGQPNVFVNFTHTGPESGSVAQPFSKLSEALPVVVPNGTININAGGSGEVLTIFEPCTLTAPSGMVTIGQ